jgi:hypothetical protein
VLFRRDYYRGWDAVWNGVFRIADTSFSELSASERAFVEPVAGSVGVELQARRQPSNSLIGMDRTPYSPVFFGTICGIV